MQEAEILFENIEFLLIAGVVIVLAYLALEHRDIVYAAFFFGFMATGVAGIFILLEAPFVAGLQIAIYTGGITALIIFGVLLIPRAQDSTLEVLHSPRMRKVGLVLSISVVVISALIALLFPWQESIPPEHIPLSQSLEGLAEWLWGTHAVYLEIIAMLLFVGLVGSVAIIRMEKEEQLRPRTEDFSLPIPEESEPESATSGMPVLEARDVKEEKEVE